MQHKNKRTCGLLLSIWKWNINMLCMSVLYELDLRKPLLEICSYWCF